MKKYLAMLAAGLLCACCVGLAACGGSSSSAASSSAASGSESASASAASESASSASASASAASANASASASSAASSEVSPELKEAAEKLVASADEQAAVVEKAKAAGSYKEFEDEWNAASAKASEATAALKPWVKQFEDGSISDADRAYYMKVVVPAASKSAQAGLDMLDLMQSK